MRKTSVYLDDAEAESLQRVAAATGRPQAELIREGVRRVIAEVDKQPELVASGGGTDANVFGKHGIQALVVGLGGENFHTVRERLPIANLIDAARFCEQLLTLE